MDDNWSFQRTVAQKSILGEKKTDNVVDLSGRCLHCLFSFVRVANKVQNSADSWVNNVPRISESFP